MRQLTKVIHEATEGVAATNVKPRKPYVTNAILEVSAHRARLIKTKHREEQQVKILDKKQVFTVWKEIIIGLKGTSAQRMFHLILLAISTFSSTTLNMALTLTKVSGRERSKRVPKQEKPRLF